jgi:hypothetical protein
VRPLAAQSLELLPVTGEASPCEMARAVTACLIFAKSGNGLPYLRKKAVTACLIFAKKIGNGLPYLRKKAVTACLSV